MKCARPTPAARRRAVLRWLLRVLVLVVCGPAFALAGAGAAEAHAVLEESDPAPESVLTTAPTQVSLRFDEPVTTLPTSLRVFGPDGQRVDNGSVRHPDESGETVAIGLASSLPHGSYLVSWRVVSADSHPVSGAFSFAIGHAGHVPSVAPDDPSRTVSVMLGVSRWAGYLGAALLVGGVAFLALCWPAGRTDVRARRILTIALATTLLAALGTLLLKGPDDAALGLRHAADPQPLREVLGTSFGRAMLARLILAPTFLALAAKAGNQLLGRVAGMLAGIALLVTYAAAGHASADSPRALAMTSDVLHLGAMSMWVGGLAMLALAAIPRLAPAEALPVVTRFSGVAATSVLVLVATGTYQAWRQVGAWAALTDTPYGRDLLVKLALVAAVLGVALSSRSWVRQGARRGPAVQPSLSRIRSTVAGEAVLAVAVLAVTSVLVATQPARSAYHPTVAANLSVGPDTVQLSAVPTGDRQMDLHLSVFDKDLRPTQPTELTATATLPDQDIGPLPVKLTRAGPGHAVGTISVPLRGDWKLTVTIRNGEFDQYDAQVTVPIR